MCTRYVFADPAEAIRDLFRITGPLPNWPPNYNVAPTHIMPVIRPIDDGREIAMMEWGLVPFFSKDGKRSFTTFNARSEELRSKPMYREPFKTRRCIVPATGYIEFSGEKGDKTAHLFTLLQLCSSSAANSASAFSFGRHSRIPHKVPLNHDALVHVCELALDGPDSPVL